MGRTLLVLSLLLAARGAVLDRIAVTVGKGVITETEILDEIRMTAFLNGEEPDYSPEARRRAAERLIDQYLVRREMNISHYPEPEASEADKMLAQLKQKRFHDNDAEHRRALKAYGIGEQELKAQLLWQLAALRFTDFRFQPDIPPPTPAPRTDEAVPSNVDQELDAWLKQVRSQTRIVYRTEAFE